MYFGIWVGWFFEPIYIYFFGSIERVRTALNQIFMAIFSVIDFWSVQLNAFLDIKKKLNAMSLFNFGSICIFAVKLRFFGKKGLSSILFVSFREKKVCMGRCSHLPCKVNLSNLHGPKKLNETILAKRGVPAAAPFRKKWVRARAGFLI